MGPNTSAYRRARLDASAQVQQVGEAHAITRLVPCTALPAVPDVLDGVLVAAAGEQLATVLADEARIEADLQERRPDRPDMPDMPDMRSGGLGGPHASYRLCGDRLGTALHQAYFILGQVAAPLHTPARVQGRRAGGQTGRRAGSAPVLHLRGTLHPTSSEEDLTP